METDQRQEIDEPGVSLEEATENLNDDDIQPHAEIVPVEQKPSVHIASDSWWNFVNKQDLIEQPELTDWLKEK